jgi:hypothetical protein
MFHLGSASAGGLPLFVFTSSYRLAHLSTLGLASLSSFEVKFGYGISYKAKLGVAFTYPTMGINVSEKPVLD